MDEKHTKQKTSIFRYLNPKNVMTEVHRYGYDFSLPKFLRLLLLFYLGIGAVSFLYGLHWPFIIGIMVFCSLFFPFLILITYKYMYEQKKFKDVTEYMEQLIFSFKRKPKIRIALIETLSIFPEGPMHDAIASAIHHIETATSGNKIYEEAFAFIEEEYGCKRLYTLHDFLVKVETLGGDFENSMEILLEDKQLWVNRIYALQDDMKKYKMQITLCVVFSFVILGTGILMLPKEFGITDNLLSQITTAIVISLNFIIWFIGQYKLSGSLINVEKNTPFRELERDYNRVMHGDLKKSKRKGLVVGICLLPLAVLFHFLFHYNPLTIGMVAFAYICGSNPGRVYKKSVKKITREIEKVFPEWLMEMALLLQAENLHVSLSRTIASSPLILREELERLLAGIDEKPNSIDPYLQFFDRFDIPDVVTAMKMLYSIGEYGSEEIGKQISSLVQRNTTLMDKAAKLHAQDYLAGVGFLGLLPMLTGVFKLLVDMVLAIFGLLSMTTLIG